LDPNEIGGLKPSHISSQKELNEAEQANILRATVWARGKRHPDLLSESFVRNLHRRMFHEVWTWAGTYRTSDKSIGAPKEKVLEELHKLLHDIAYWKANNTYYWVERFARFHHRLVSIHPFPNGNGRHARLMTDLLVEDAGERPLSWGGARSLTSPGTTRAAYIDALRAADGRKYEKLIAFVQSG
jgi:Fic-DOC domain mobile mystery protein B